MLVAPAYVAPNTVIRAYVQLGETKHELGKMVASWKANPEVWFVKGGMSLFIAVEGFDDSVLKPEDCPEHQDVAAVFVLAKLCNNATAEDFKQ